MKNSKDNTDLIKGLKEIDRKKQQIKEDIDFVNDIQEKYIIKRNRNYLRIIIIGSAAAIIILFFSIIGPSLKSVNYSDLFVEYYSPIDSDIIKRTGADNFSAQENAIRFYHGQDYKKADFILDSLLIHNNSNEQLLLYKALIELENKKIVESRNRLSLLISAGGTISIQARWYLVLIELIQKHPEKAREHLMVLKKTPDKPYKDEVKKLLRKIRFRKTK